MENMFINGCLKLILVAWTHITSHAKIQNQSARTPISIQCIQQGKGTASKQIWLQNYHNVNLARKVFNTTQCR